MRITYVPLVGKRRHPLGRSAAIALVKQVLAEVDLFPLEIREVHFGWNARTTQEGRVIRRGHWIEIRINFTVEDDRSAALSKERRWLTPAIACGGVVDTRAHTVTWPDGSAERYCTFLLLHELAHLAYGRMLERGGSRRNSRAEESFCDTWALARLRVWQGGSVSLTDKRTGDA